MKTRPLPTRCPLCAGAVHVERVRCESCESAVEGRFDLGWQGALTPEQLAFVKVFLVCRGKIKDVEQALGLSYPTVVSRLDDLVAALGSDARASEAGPLQPQAALGGATQKPGGPTSPPVQQAPTEQPLDVLEQLARGDIDVNEAERRLKKKR